MITTRTRNLLLGAALAGLVLALLGLSLATDRGTRTAVPTGRGGPATSTPAEPRTAAERVASRPAGDASGRDSLPAAPVPSAPVETLEAGAFEEDAVYGLVLGAEDQPLADARVLLFDESGLTPEGLLAERRTDAGGRFRFREIAPFVTHTLYAEAEGHAPRWVRGVSGHDVELELETAATISGRVFLGQGGPPGVGVRVTANAGHWDGTKYLGWIHTFSDEEGHYSLPWLPVNEVVLIYAHTQRGGHETWKFQVDPEKLDGYDLVIEDLEGPGMRFHELTSGQPLAEFDIEFLNQRFRTDSGGRLLHPPPSSNEEGPVRDLVVAADGWCRTQILPRETYSADLVVPMTRGARLTGRVVDAAGEPVSGARVYVQPDRSRRGTRSPTPTVPDLPEGFRLRTSLQTVRTDALGRFEFAGVAPQPVPQKAQAFHPGYPVAGPLEVMLDGIGKEAEIELVFDAGSILTGTVFLDGEPLSTRLNWTNEERSGWAESNDQGRYRFRGVPPGEVRVDARVPGKSSRSRALRGEPVWIDGALVEHDVWLVANSNPIRGRVRDDTGEPVAGATVSAWAREGSFRGNVRTETEEDGSFVLDVEAPQGILYRCLVRDGVRRATLAEVAPGTTGLEFVLPRPGALLARAQDASTGEALRDFRLFWRADEESEFESVGDWRRGLAPGPDGTFEVELPVGQVDLFLTSEEEGYRPLLVPGVRVDESPGARPLTLRLDRGTTLILELDVAGSVRSKFQSWFRKRPGVYTPEEIRAKAWKRNDLRLVRRLVRLEDGTYRVAGLAPGTYRIPGVPKGLELSPASIELPAVGRQEVRIRVRPSSRPK